MTKFLFPSNFDISKRGAVLSNEEIFVGYANSFHDPAFAFVHKEKVFAEAIERESQVKRAYFFTGLALNTERVRHSLTRLGFPFDNPRLIVSSTWSFTFLEKLTHPIRKFWWKIKPIWVPSPKEDITHDKTFTDFTQFGTLWYQQGLPLFNHVLAQSLFKNKFQSLHSTPIRHHLTHAANAVFTSNFDDCAVMIIDGLGEKHGTTFYHFKNNRFTPLSNTKDSLGFLYCKITGLCGFSARKGEEWKVMGLAAYGKYDESIYQFFKKRISISDLEYKLSFTNSCFKELGELSGGFRTPEDKNVLKAANLAYNFQLFFTDVVCELAENLQKKTNCQNLAFAGGCALNSSANGKIIEKSGFKNLHVPFAPADDGNALGAALYSQWSKGKSPKRKSPMSPYLGSEIDIENLEKILSFGHLDYVKTNSAEELVDLVSSHLANGKITGWMQGRAEFGPRALGNRSILADPRSKDMKDKINSLVKFREEYRPIAPSILHESGEEYFEDYQFSPYMERTLTFNKDVRSKVPAVVHEDQTGRLQSVTKELNPLYHQLISKFEEKSGVPLVVNTSLNVMGKPIVDSVIDAITLFQTTGLHVLAIGPYVLKKREIEQ